jgi:hypothetical protein
MQCSQMGGGGGGARERGGFKKGKDECGTVCS